MAPADIRTLLDKRPFLPFRVVTTDSTTYEVWHPELVILSLASAVIGYPDPVQPRVAARYDIVSLRHIIRLEPMESQEPASAASNGQP